MEFLRLSTAHFDELSNLHAAYKAEIGEQPPTEAEFSRLKDAMATEKLLFFGCVYDGVLVACCSVCLTFSTFHYAPSGVFEDFYILPAYRHQGIARKLVTYAREHSGVASLTVGCADCDVEMYQALGFTVSLGNLLATE